MSRKPLLPHEVEAMVARMKAAAQRAEAQADRREVAEWIRNQHRINGLQGGGKRERARRRAQIVRHRLPYSA